MYVYHNRYVQLCFPRTHSSWWHQNCIANFTSLGLITLKVFLSNVFCVLIIIYGRRLDFFFGGGGGSSCNILK